MKVQYLAYIAKALNVTTDYLIYGSEPFEQNAEINAILSSMSEEKRKQVEKMKTVLVDTVQISTNNILEKKIADDKQGDRLFNRLCSLCIAD
ncbi:MAG: hypothetical protein K2J77_02650 [Oscillospiraceae bacterium]|nr:hypothetical protein [Oscillospiraceae bacterium]